MLNLQLATEQDRREAALIDKRRATEEERKKRIFNARQRLFGIDYSFLQKQIDEKRQRDAEAARIEKVFDEQRKKQDEIALALDKKEKQERVKLEREINYFRMCCQRPENRREFDLNDPNQRKKEVPVRTSDNDPRIGPSSAQKFEGEDLQSLDRAKMQQDQMKAWLDQQIKEKEAADKERQFAEETYREAILTRDQRALQLDNMEKECRKRLEDACLKFNRALADERKMEEMKRLKREHEDSFAEMYNFMTSDLLTENPEASQSNLGAGRKIGYMYKGMTLEEKKKIREYQIAQIEEMKKRKEFEKRRDREFDDFLNGTQSTIALMDKEQERKQRESVRQLAEENRKLAVEQKMRKEFLDKVVYTNRPTEEFYDQFNKSTR
ncbi:RIB43A-like with coiled-coils protein 2 [Asbolus verrucosus]|uniref:RIB43A-like with coiled-coils protein 2 n=1 Tax=Asbolus verrucosus TaxID=1661398 RepID=A0A482VEA1_ASBVE|nr:RIB43A-like with coiled-coils protein 2 [Asbolus verrucosus]